MPDDSALRIFPDEYVPNAEGADYHRRWVKANPGEAARWAAFRDAIIATGNGAIPVMATKYGKALVAAGKEHMSISRLVGQMTPPYPPPDPPPTGGNPYFVSDWSAGTFGSPWTTLFYNGSPGFVDLS